MKKIIILVISIFIALTPGISVLGYTVENLKLPKEGDIVLGPGKIEILADPGEEFTRELLITNRTGADRLIRIEVEDFRGTKDPQRTVEFVGPDEENPFSLRNYVHPDIKEIILSHGQRLRLPVKIIIPENAEPGGLYGAVMISSTEPTKPGSAVEKEKAKGKIKVITRLATLIFVRVKGEVKEEGRLTEFKVDKRFYEKGPISFALLYENTGNVHLDPYGVIEIKNIFGKKVGEIQLDPWFAMPDSVRLKKVKWEKGFLCGRYSAVAKINRGYKDIIDEKTVSFWVIPWKIIVPGFIVLIAVIWLIIWIATHFEIRKKSEKKEIE